MDNLLLNYMNARFKTGPVDMPCKEDGPVITISRETGCPGEGIAAALHAVMNEKDICHGKGIWRVISKEILLEAASELNLNPDKIRYIFDSEHRSTMDEILAALSTQYYKSERSIRKTITEVIINMAERGYVIILGRGGASLLENKRSALHIKLMAPVDWRAGQLVNYQNIKEEGALELIAKEDAKRLRLINSFKKDKRKKVVYDATFDCSRLSNEAIVKAITAIAESLQTTHRT